MRNIESVVAAEVVPMLDVALPEEVIGNLPPEHMDALKVVNPITPNSPCGCCLNCCSI